MIDLTKKQVFAGALTLVLLFTGAYMVSDFSGNEGNQNITDWKKVELEEVSSGEKFSISELEKPVLVETFAVWCPTCTRQQQEIKKLHSQMDIRSVSLDVDPNEDKTKVRKHIQKHGFNWMYTISPPEVTKSLINEYGQVMVNPPSVPMILVCENGTRKLPTGVKPVSKLKEEIRKGC